MVTGHKDAKGDFHPHSSGGKTGVSENDMKISVKGNNDVIKVQQKPVSGTKGEKDDFFVLDKNNVNEIELDEITIGALSDGDFFRKVINPNVENITRRMLRGDFQKQYLYSKKSFIDNLGRLAIETYEKEFGNPDDPMKISVDTRRAIGMNVAEKIFNLASESARFKNNEKRDFLVKTKTGFRDEFVKSNDNISSAMSSF